MHIPELISFVTEPLPFPPDIDIEKASQQRARALREWLQRTHNCECFAHCNQPIQVHD